MNKRIIVSAFLFVFLSVPLALQSAIKLPEIFSDYMVLQRQMPIPVWGSADPGHVISVQLNEHKAKVASGPDGQWKVVLPEMEAGGPFKLVIEGNGEAIELKDILIGEVWLCSGQSNMAWPLSRSANGETEIPNADIPKIRLYKMEIAQSMGKAPFPAEDIQTISAGNFFKATSWQLCTPESADDFSAVGYFFGRTLFDSLNVPIGLIQNAVGGSPIQSWISREALAAHPQLKEFVDFPENSNWLDLKNINPWLKSRAKENLAAWFDAGEEGTLPGHPFAPFFLYESAIETLLPFAIKGAIWYQGESNATHPDSHQALFELMVDNWRSVWGQGDFPVYFVQLPRISNRSRWPEFRETQAACLSIKNTGMAVAIDQGHLTNVHPKEKRVIGNRLAALALAKTYGKIIVAESPMLLFYDWNINKGRLRLNFKNTGTGLSTRDNQQPLGFTLQGYAKKDNKEAIESVSTMKIVGNSITIVLPKDMWVTKVKYAWAPFPENNVVNSVGLPMAPFKIELAGNN